MLKRGFAIFLFVFILLSSFSFGLNNVSAVDIPVDVNQLEQQAEDLENRLDNLENTMDEIQNPKYGKWDFIGPEIQKIILKNKFVSAADSFFKKINIVFVIFFGEDYNFSLGFLIAVILWFYFFIQFSEIIRNFSTFGEGVSTVIGLALTLIMAQMGLLRAIVKGLGWLVASPEAWWWRTLIFMGLCVFFVFAARARYKLGLIQEAKKKEREDMEEKSNRRYLDIIVDAFKGMFS